MVGGDGPHGGIRTARAHRPDHSQWFTQPLLPKRTVSVQDDFDGLRIRQRRQEPFPEILPQLR
jgi:hypothetical protein